MPEGALTDTRDVFTTAPLTGGGALTEDLTLGISDFVASGSNHARGTVPDPGATPGTSKFLREDATWATTPGGSEAFPVGSVFLSVVATNPATLLGYGTWSAIGAGRTLIGLDAGDTDFDTVEKIGGAKTVVSAGTNATSTVTPLGSVAAPVISWPAGVPTNAAEAAHTHAAGAISWPAGVPTISGIAVSDHASHTHTYTQVVNHVHVQAVNTATTGALSGYTPDTSTSTSATSGYSTANPTGGVATGTTAGPGATLTHTVSNQGTIAWPAGVPTGAATGAGSSHNHVISWPAGVPTATAPAFTGQSSTVGAQTFTGSATSVVQPYFVVYFWKRTA